MAQDVFQDELRRLLEQTNNAGPMYEGWQNPMNQPGQKAEYGVYATPWDRQGGPAVAQAELEQQVRGIVSRFVDNPATLDEAMRAMFGVLRGQNQSPADQGGGAPPLEVNKQFQYGASDAAYSALAQKGFSKDDILKYQAMRAAEKEEEERERRERDEKDRKEREEREKKEREGREEREKKEREEKEMAARLAPVVEALVQSRVSQTLSAYGIQPQQAAQAAPTAPSQGVQGSTPWQQLPGVNVPLGMQPGALQPPMQGALSAPTQNASPHQAKADAFLRIAQAKLSALTDVYQKGRAREQVVNIYTGLLSGAAVHIDDPLLQGWAQEAGVPFTDMSGGLGVQV